MWCDGTGGRYKMRSTLSRISPPVSSMPIIGTRCTGSPCSLIENMRSRSSSHTVGLVSKTLPCRSRRVNDPALPIERHSASVKLNPSHRQLPSNSSPWSNTSDRPTPLPLSPHMSSFPSLIGFGFSSAPPIDQEFVTLDNAYIIDKLMRGLGFRSGYIAQRGDVGSIVSCLLGERFEACKGGVSPFLFPACVNHAHRVT